MLLAKLGTLSLEEGTGACIPCVVLNSAGGSLLGSREVLSSALAVVGSPCWQLSSFPPGWGSLGYSERVLCQEPVPGRLALLG